ncbi:hypothetical protein Tco_0245392 [Tanacetum coccineum]
MTDKEAKSTTRKIVTNDQADYYSGITSITVNGKNAYELKGKFLDDLHKNAFSGTHGEDAKLGSDETEPTSEETSDLEETNHNDEQEIGEIFRIETNLFDYETLLCEKFKEFNYLLKIDPNLLTKDIEGFKTYNEYKDDWIYEWNENVPWVHKKPWTDTRVRTEPTPVVHYCKPFNYKGGYSEWPTCSWKEDGYCNGGNLLGAYIIGNTLRYQDLEWYDALKDNELKDEALRNKAIIEGLIDEEDESSNNDKEIFELFDDHELSVCNIRRFEMVKYSFGDNEEYVDVKEDEYDELKNTSKEVIHAYREIFRMMDEGWMDLGESKEIDEVGVGDEEVVVREGVVVISSSLEMLTNNYLGGIMVSLIFLEGLDEEALISKGVCQNAEIIAVPRWDSGQLQRNSEGHSRRIRDL